MAKDNLTLKQEAFVLAYLETGNASEAYRRAYDAEDMDAQAIAVEAHKLRKHPKIANRLNGLQEKAETKAILSLEDHMTELLNLRELAKQNGQVSAAIKAEELRGKLRRFYVEQHEHGEAGDFSKLSDDEMRSLLAQEAQALAAIDGSFKLPAATVKRSSTKH